LGIITTPLICLGIITVLIFGDYYVAFWGLLLCSISGIIQATPFKVCSLHPARPRPVKKTKAKSVVLHFCLYRDRSTLLFVPARGPYQGVHMNHMSILLLIIICDLA
jgi:hypothetical protein